MGRDSFTMLKNGSRVMALKTPCLIEAGLQQNPPALLCVSASLRENGFWAVWDMPPRSPALSRRVFRGSNRPCLRTCVSTGIISAAGYKTPPCDLLPSQAWVQGNHFAFLCVRLCGRKPLQRSIYGPSTPPACGTRFHVKRKGRPLQKTPFSFQPFQRCDHSTG